MRGSFYSTTGRSNLDGNGPEFHFEIRPKPRLRIELQNATIIPILPNRQLELGKRVRNLTCYTGIGRRWRRHDDGGKPVQTIRNCRRNSSFPVKKNGGLSSGLREGSIGIGHGHCRGRNLEN
ncbi:unnamed protein product [Prunus armeniaca]